MSEAPAPIAPAPAAAPPAPEAAPAPDASLLGRVPPEPAPVQVEALPAWMDGLPDDLKSNPGLARYKDQIELAKGLLETKKMVGDRVMLPKADDPDSFERFAAAIRPENADVYKIDLPDGVPADFADHMRPVFHDIALLPQQAEKLVAANNAYVAAQAAAAEAEGAAVVTKLQNEMGRADYEQSKIAAVAMLERMGIPAQFDSDMARFMGAENSLRYFFALAKSTGELGKVHDADVAIHLGTLNAADATREAAKITSSRDPGDIKKLRDPNSDLSKRLDSLAEIIARGR